MSSRTIFLGKLIGIFCILIALAMSIHKQATVDVVMAMLHNAPLLFVLGVITTAAGIAMVLAHNIWSGGAMPVLVTIIGWISLIKGLMLVVLSPEGESTVMLLGLRYEQMFYVYMAIMLVLGIYLTYAGSTSKKSM